MPTDRTRFDWNNSGVHGAHRHVRLDSDSAACFRDAAEAALQRIN